MRVPLSWIGLLLILSVLVYFSVYGYKVYESFQPSVKEGFTMGVDELRITTCPAKTNYYVDKNGISLCCDGDVKGTRCEGRIACAISEGGGQLPTCGQWYKAYLDQKGQGRCPPSMPHYFESKDGRTKGCAAQGLNDEGTGPRSLTTAKCILYATASEEDT